MAFTESQFNEAIQHLRDSISSQKIIVCNEEVNIVDILLKSLKTYKDEDLPIETDRTQEWFEQYYNENVA